LQDRIQLFYGCSQADRNPRGEDHGTCIWRMQCRLCD
jgi:hypothetical protein